MINVRSLPDQRHPSVGETTHLKGDFHRDGAADVDGLAVRHLNVIVHTIKAERRALHPRSAAAADVAAGLFVETVTGQQVLLRTGQRTRHVFLDIIKGSHAVPDAQLIEI